ncbi:MAG: Esa1p-associated factor [Pleopsidium flavum]|nr:MAG: Esa1p-associated factor [Pleopsidium flavum]
MAPPYIKDERVLCFHHELLYEAKILDSRPSDTSDKKSLLQYRVHYKGWKNTWDDWVPQDRLRKLTDENKQLAQDLKHESDAAHRQRTAPTKATPASTKKKAAGSDLSSTRGSEERNSSVPATGRGLKRGRDFEIEKVGNPDITFLSPLQASFTDSTKPSHSSSSSSFEDTQLSTFTSFHISTAEPRRPLRRGRARDLWQKENETAGGYGYRDLPTAEEILSKPPPVDSRRRAMLRDIPESYMSAQHPQLMRLNFEDPGNETKRQFFKARDPNDTLMIAGYIEEFSIHPLKGSSNSQQEEAFHSRPAVRLHIPDHLKAILVDDWENVTKNLQLVPLPSKNPTNAILTTYFDEEKMKRRLGSAEADILEEVVAGVKEYFDKCLGRILLYRFEREQFFEIRQLWESGKSEWDGKGPGDVYGAEHLCRLFGASYIPYFLQIPRVLIIIQLRPVSMPELIAQTNMDHQSVNRLREELSKLTTWLGKNSNRFFTSEYENASQEYIEKARGV